MSFLTAKKKDHVARCPARGGGKALYGQCPFKNVFFIWTPSLMVLMPSLISRTYLHQHLLLLCIYPLHHYCKAIFIHDPSSGKDSTIFRFSSLVSPGSSISCNSPINSLSGPNHAHHHNNYITAPSQTHHCLHGYRVTDHRHVLGAS